MEDMPRPKSLLGTNFYKCHVPHRVYVQSVKQNLIKSTRSDNRLKRITNVAPINYTDKNKNKTCYRKRYYRNIHR